jgi:RNA polymerase sigma factor (sigma-70 family)
LQPLILTLHLHAVDKNSCEMDALAATPRSRLAAPRRLLRLRSDAYLAERFADGDEAAFSILFERHRASVLAVCIGVLGSRHDAEDAAQETFASLAVALRSSPPRELRAWLARVARNSSIDLARRRRTRDWVNDELSDVGGDHDGVSSSQLVKDELESVIAGIRELPESQRTALLMRELAGHSYREIAELLETDEEAVRGLIARARIGLRQHREAAELPCAAARAAIAAEPDGRRHDRTLRRHVRGCASCRAYRAALRGDARALRGLIPVQAGGAASGSAVVGLAAKGALLGTAATQVTAACAVSVCAVGGIALLAPAPASHDPLRGGATHHTAERRASSVSGRSDRSLVLSPPRFSPGGGAIATGGHSSPSSTAAGLVGRTQIGSFRAVSSSSGTHASVSSRGTYTVPAGGRPQGSSQPSGGQRQGSNNPAAQGPAAPGSSNPSGTDSVPAGGQQTPAAPPSSSSPDEHSRPGPGADAGSPASGPPGQGGTQENPSVQGAPSDSGSGSPTGG